MKYDKLEDKVNSLKMNAKEITEIVRIIMDNIKYDTDLKNLYKDGLTRFEIRKKLVTFLRDALRTNPTVIMFDKTDFGFEAAFVSDLYQSMLIVSPINIIYENEFSKEELFYSNGEWLCDITNYENKVK